MNERLVTQLWWVTTGAVGFATLIAWHWGKGMAMGVFAGGLWNLVSLWCLSQLLHAWLGTPRPAGHQSRPPQLLRGSGQGGGQPSRRRAIAWLLVKFPLLYFIIFRVFQSPEVSVLGFGVGFTIVLGVSLVWWVWQAKRMGAAHVHGS
ncbi:MAG: hypothetical protein HY352_06935 [Candidatus Omnitrophica bacterium]|nr:hypothetical protein [Candidatus Omnitrophota bacterium]